MQISPFFYFYMVTRLVAHTFFVLTLMLVSCKSKNQYNSKPARSNATVDTELLDLSAAVYHYSDSVSTVFLRISNENLLYKRPDTSRTFYASMQVFFQLLSAGNPRKVVDSGTFMMHDRAGAEKVEPKHIYSRFDISALPNNNYLLEVEVYDMNHRTKCKKEVNVNKENPYSGQNFVVFSHDSVVFADNVHKGRKVEVRYRDFSANFLDVDVFRHEFGPAPPPFSMREADPLKYKPDSSFTLLGSAGIFTVVMPMAGFYHFRPPGSAEQGLTLHTYEDAFPGVSNAKEMIECTRYIMSRDEFEKCMKADDKKAAIDHFWLSVGGSNERARELLKKYYGRVKEANERYTSYTQGWKSDRGMIYIIFGPPVNQYRSRKDEIWVYGNEANPATLRFVFNKTRNPYSDNDYIMERSQFYKEPWHSAVDYWRQGNVYLDQRR